jgi:hypothetical protein
VNSSSSTNGAVISGNVIKQDAVLATPQFYAVFVDASSNVDVLDNKITMPTTINGGHGVFVYTDGTNLSNIKVNGNTFVGGTVAYVRFDQTGGTTTTRATVANNIGSGGSAACVGIQLASVDKCSVVGNEIDTTTVAALSVVSCTKVQLAANKFESTGTTTVSTAGTCTGSYMDRSNYWGTTDSLMNNGATGFNVEWRSTAVPAAGTWARGDHWIQLNSTAAAAPGGYCTVAGTPGTWKNEAVIAA